ncbi:hypothetical protein H1R20_g4568, partial [Candolleomyces eurysporus]
MVTLPASAKSSQNVVLPEIAELFNDKFLDVLLPPAVDAEYEMVVDPSESSTVVETPKNPMIEALKATTNQVLTDNSAPALASTTSPTLDAFNGISQNTDGASMNKLLSEAWAEDSNLTLRIIWASRSIPDGKGSRDAFYKAFGWLYENHPRTAIANIHLLADAVVVNPKTNSAVSHGYWKDLLNILSLATTNSLTPDTNPSSALTKPAQKRTSGGTKGRRGGRVARPSSSRSTPAEHLERNAQRKKDAQKVRAEAFVSSHERLVSKLGEPKYRALYIAATRLFGERLLKDVAILGQLKTVPAGDEKLAVLKTLSLVGKWAPTPACSHDKVTNLSSAIALYIYHAKPSLFSLPEGSLDNREKTILLRHIFGRSILKPLREVIECPEPKMAANKWTDIKYTRVPSTAMKNNNEHFYKHDPEGFEKYLLDVESGKKQISGATLFPHEIIAQILESSNAKNTNATTVQQKVKAKLADNQLKVAEAQWKALIANLRAAGKVENSIAICDVSGSMGSLHYGTHDVKHPQPILVAVSLSLVLSSLAAPPFGGGFITFSEKPQYLTVDLEGKSLNENIQYMMRSDWGMNTNLNAVFMDLLLPLAKKNNIKQEDMIKRLFIFSDMQFDQADHQGKVASNWETNYDVIEKGYKEAGYEVPQIVFWDLNATPGKTVEVTAERRGVAMMNGFSPSLMKVFMGEEEEDDPEATEWAAVDKEGDVTTVKKDKKDDFTPVNVMKKALLKESFNGLKVLD